LQRDIAAVQADLAGTLPGLRWTRPDTIHLTLRFFGAANTDVLEKIRTSMLSVRLRARPFQVDVLGLGAFPDHRRPRVVWLGLTPKQPLRALRQACEDELIRRDIFRFSPFRCSGTIH
jgi:2'-5' RNA ligase